MRYVCDAVADTINWVRESASHWQSETARISAQKRRESGTGSDELTRAAGGSTKDQLSELVQSQARPTWRVRRVLAATSPRLNNFT
ncbi:hypothetical protein B5X24_HaOG216300 [Helicoverpa armigera]|nr:hypothetical protein B5X24_HaOG216300 [Helicoverpa armigera]